LVVGKPSFSDFPLIVETRLYGEIIRMFAFAID